MGNLIKRTVLAYWCWTKGELLCVPCWEKSGLAGQVQYGGDLIRGERCARCGADPAEGVGPARVGADR
jgi:hypothetical protein